MSQTPTTTRAAYAIVSALHLCAAILTCDAARRFDPYTGQPRELINQPSCWIVETFEDLSRCEIAGRRGPPF